MSYADNLLEEVINSQFLVVINPRKKILHSSFTLHSGSVYYASLTSGYGVAVSIDGTTLTAGSSTSLSAGEFYFDNDTSRIYLRKGDSTAPDSNDFIVVTYEIFISTYDAHWYRIPTDNTTQTVYFDPRITRSPVISQASTDVLFGFFPVKSTNISLANTDHFFESIISDDSFNKTTIKMWHLLGTLSTSNMRLVFSGNMGSVTFSGETVEINVLDQTDLFDQEFRHNSGTSFYATSDFSELDPNFQARPIRDIFGVVDGFIPVNVDYLLDTPATTDNRIFSVKKGQSNLSSITRTVLAGSTATTTNLDDSTGFRSGDSVWFDRAVGVDEYLIISSVDYGANTITHSALSGGAMAASDTCKRGFVGRIDIVQENTSYQPKYGRDYTINSSLANGCSGFTLANNFEATLGMASTFSPDDFIYCRVYGDSNTETLGGPAFGANDSECGNLTQGIVVLYRILKSKLGLAESELDTAVFTSLQSTLTDTVGFAVPQKANEDFPTYKDICLSLMQTLLLRIYKNNSDVWTLGLVGPMGSYDKLIEDDEITRASLSYSFEYSDMHSDLLVEYSFRERSAEKSSINENQYKKKSANSNNANYLHLQKRQHTIQSVHYDDTQAQTLATRLSYALGERRGLLTIETKNRFFDVLLGDIVRVSREKLPGFSYVEGTSNTKDFVVIESTKSLNKVTLILDDQKGIEDNSGSW